MAKIKEFQLTTKAKQELRLLLKDFDDPNPSD